MINSGHKVSKHDQHNLLHFIAAKHLNNEYHFAHQRTMNFNPFVIRRLYL